MKRLVSLMLTLVLLLGCCNMFTVAQAATPDPGSIVTPNEWMTLTHTATLRYGSNTVTCNVKYIISYNEANASGYKIASIEPVSYVSKTGWYAVDSSSFEIVQEQGYDNYQKVVLTISYKASIGSGYETYLGTTTIEVPGYDG